MPLLAFQWTDWDETWVVTSGHVPDMSAMMWLLWQRPLLSHGALNIQLLRVSGGQTREPIFMKFGIQQQIKTSIIATSSNIKKTRWRTTAMSENIGNAITRLPMDRLVRNLGGRIQPTPLPQNLFFWYWSLPLTAQWTFWLLWGVTSFSVKAFTILMKLGWLCAAVLQKRNLVEKQQILIQKNLRSSIIVNAHCSMTHLKQQKSFGFY